MELKRQKLLYIRKPTPFPFNVPWLSETHDSDDQRRDESWIFEYMHKNIIFESCMKTYLHYYSLPLG